MYRRKAKGWYKHIDFIILDIICLELSFLIAYIYPSWCGESVSFSTISKCKRSCLDLADFVLHLCMHYMQEMY